MDGFGSQESLGRWRVPAIAAGVLLIVVMPFLFLQNLSRNNLAAADAVAHTHKVESAVTALALTVREVESASMVIVLGGDLPSDPAAHHPGPRTDSRKLRELTP